MTSLGNGTDATGDPVPSVRRGLWDRIESGWITTIGTGMFLTATVIMLCEAAGRAFFDHSYFWAEEAVRFLIIWAFFLTLGAAGRNGYHIRTDLVVAALSHRMRVVVAGLAALVGIAFSAILFWGSIPQIQRYYSLGMLSESNMELPMWLVFMALPIGALFFGIYYIRLIAQVIQGRDPFSDDLDGAAGKF